METTPVEEYLGAIYGLLEEGKKAKTTGIAKKLKVKPASVTEMLKKLSRDDYTTYLPYRGVVLTRKGLKVASKIKRKHRLLERFLYDILGIKKENVHREACRMEHVLSDEAEKAMDEMMGRPRTCPDDGKPIPGRHAAARHGEERLLELKVGEKAEVTGFLGGRAFRNNLTTMGIREGKTVEVEALQPMGGPVVVKTGNTTVALGRGMASKITVKTGK